MRPVNLLVLSEGLQSVPKDLLVSFEAQLCERSEPLDGVKPHEASSIVRLRKGLQEHGAQHPRLFEGFAYSFRIPQISSEFDLLKVCDDVVINVELKSEDVGLERIGRQLVRNRYYLTPLGRTMHLFSFVSDSGTLFELDESGTVVPVGFERLVEVLGEAGTPYDGRLEDLFEASNYLVSPLNDTQKFLEGSYFLTNHQAQIKESFLKACAAAGAGATAPAFLVYGSPGTGKTLLLYDLARSLPVRGQVCVIHCGLLSEGHAELNRAQTAFCVMPARRSERVSLQEYGAILVDEVQRMWPSQLEHIVAEATAHDIPLYLSMDRRQVLTRKEEQADPERIIRSGCAQLSVWRLSRKIRTNRELVAFLRMLFELKGGTTESVETRHVKVSCAQGACAARVLVDAYRNAGYQYVSVIDEHDGQEDRALLVSGCPHANEVIGQEFDKVVMAIGPKWGETDGERDDFRYRQLVFQGLTRARSQIALVVYDNDALLARLLG